MHPGDGQVPDPQSRRSASSSTPPAGELGADEFGASLLAAHCPGGVGLCPALAARFPGLAVWVGSSGEGRRVSPTCGRSSAAPGCGAGPLRLHAWARSRGLCRCASEPVSLGFNTPPRQPGGEGRQPLEADRSGVHACFAGCSSSEVKAAAGLAAGNGRSGAA